MLADIGEGIAEVEMMQWFVRAGDEVKEFDNICEVQSDKATVEITSRYSGRVTKVNYEVGDIVPVGQALVEIEVEDGGSAAPAPASGAGEEPAAAAKEASAPAAAPPTEPVSAAGRPPARRGGPHGGADKVLTTPAVRRIAREHGIDLSGVAGSGQKGRILKEDVLAVAASGAAPFPAETLVEAAPPAFEALAPAAAAAAADPFARYREVAGTTQPCRGLQRLMVKSMEASLSVPHMGYADEVGMDALFEARSALKAEFELRGVRLSYMPFLIKAASLALLEQPVLNSSLSADGSSIEYHAHHHIGVAMDTPRGLAVPSIKHVEGKGLLRIAEELNALQARAAAGQLAEEDLSGTTFSLSNIGSIGGTYCAPLIVPPQVAIGALGRLRRVPRFAEAAGGGETVVPARVMAVSWSGDHRVVDGAAVARFSNAFKGYAEAPLRMLAHLR